LLYKLFSIVSYMTSLNLVYSGIRFTSEISKSLTHSDLASARTMHENPSVFWTSSALTDGKHVKVMN